MDKNQSYIEYMHNLRHAMRVISERIPEVIDVIQSKANRERDEDLNIALMPDMAFHILERKYDEIEAKLFRFNPDKEYGMVHTMWPEDMRGDER